MLADDTPHRLRFVSAAGTAPQVVPAERLDPLLQNDHRGGNADCGDRVFPEFPHRRLPSDLWLAKTNLRL